MNRRLLVVLLIAFLIAGLSSLVVYRLVGSRVAFAHRVSKTRVVTAAADLKLGAIISSANLGTTEVEGAPPKGAILKPENASGRGVVANLYQGETILEDRLAPIGSGCGRATPSRRGLRDRAVNLR